MNSPFDKPKILSWQEQTPDSLSNWFSSQARLADKRSPIQRLLGLNKKVHVLAGSFTIPTLGISRKEYARVSREILGHITEPPKFIAQGVEQAVFSIGANKVVKIGHGEFTTPPKIAQFLQPIQSGQVGNLFYHVMPKIKEEQFLDNKYEKLEKLRNVDAAIYKREDLYERLQLKLLEDAKTQGYTVQDAHAGNIAIIKRKMVITDWGFTERTKLTKGILIDLRDRVIKEGVDIQDSEVAQKLRLARNKNCFSQERALRNIIREGKVKAAGIKELRERAARAAARVAKASHLAPGRSIPEIEGLAHGGIAAILRKAGTAFGSGWQGHMKAAKSGGSWNLDPSFYESVFGEGTAGVTISSHVSTLRLAGQAALKDNITNASRLRIERLVGPEVLGIAMQWRMSLFGSGVGAADAKRGVSDLRQADIWHRTTGFYPTFVNSRYGTVEGADTRTHELIHASHLGQEEHPFFLAAEKEAGSLENAIPASWRRNAQSKRDLMVTTFSEQIRLEEAELEKILTPNKLAEGTDEYHEALERKETLLSELAKPIPDAEELAHMVEKAKWDVGYHTSEFAKETDPNTWEYEYHRNAMEEAKSIVTDPMSKWAKDRRSQVESLEDIDSKLTGTQVGSYRARNLHYYKHRTDTIAKHVAERDRLLTMDPDQLDELMQQYGEGVVKSYQDQIESLLERGEVNTASFVARSEPIAHHFSNPKDRFLERAEAVGVYTPAAAGRDYEHILEHPDAVKHLNQVMLPISKTGGNTSRPVRQLATRLSEFKQEIKVVKKVMSNGEGSSRVGTGIYNSIAKGVRRFKGV